MMRSIPLSSLEEEFPGVQLSQFRDELRAVVPRDSLYGVLKYLKEEQHFDLLVDLTCVDYLHYRQARDRFGLVYQLANTANNDRITLRVYLNEPELVVSTAVSLWPVADWLEREVWDMFGITFEGHPDHRRILLPEAFAAHPLRKDYPLQGRGERHNFPVLTRGDANRPGDS